MKYLLLILLLTGCATYYNPKGNIGAATAYYIDYRNEVVCDYCGNKSELFKIINDKKIMCHICFRKRFR